MRALVTGATGFIGGRVVRTLLERDWDVTALVRTPERAAHLRDAGVTLVGGDVTEPATLPGPMRRADALFHLAAWYQLGVVDRYAMYRTNVKGTEAVMSAAAEAGVARIVYCSSVAVLGQRPDGEIADETQPHPGRFGSIYEETKWQAAELVRGLAAEGAPVLSVLPGAVYGPEDPSVLGTLLRFYAKGWLLACPFMDGGFSWVHVDDVAAGIVDAFERGRDGEEYVLGGDNETVRGLLNRISGETGIRPPRWEVPARLVRATAPLSPLIARAIGQAPHIVREGISSMSGTYFASSRKAEREIGYRWRALEEGMPETVKWFAGR